MVTIGDNRRLLRIMGIRDPGAKLFRTQSKSGGYWKAVFSWFPIKVGAPEEDIGVLYSAANPNKFLGQPMSFALEEEYRAGPPPPGSRFHNHPNCSCFLAPIQKKTK